jgi:DNA-binding transcriptional MerR regulator
MTQAMKIGKFAKKAGVTTRTIRYYEELGLINPSEYSSGGIRLYSEIDLLKLKLISDLKELDFSLDNIKSIFLSDQNNSEQKDICCNLEKQLVNITSNVSRYLEIKNELEISNNVLESCKDCSKKPTYENCSDCSQIPKGEKPLILRALF